MFVQIIIWLRFTLCAVYIFIANHESVNVRGIKKSFYFLSYFTLVLSTISFGQPNTWDGSLDGDWHKSCNWSLDLVPTCAHDVVVPDLATDPDITGIAHCKTIEIQGNAILDIIGTGKLEVSDAGSCVGTATSNSGCTIPGSAWTGNGSSNNFGTFTCFSPPIQSKCKVFNNNTDFNITLDLSTVTKPCGTWSPSSMPVIPAQGSVGVCLNTPSGCCPFTNAIDQTVSWTSTDMGSGTITVRIRTDID